MAAMHVLVDRVNSRVTSGIRPFDIGRDLRPVARLIAEAFADELDASGEAALRELRMLGHMSGLIRLLTRGTGELQDIFSGFVWVEEGRLVGNVTVHRAGSQSGRWQIANVAVSPAHRGRGISRMLMETALEYIDEMDGNWAVLQVRQSNPIALGLYERMGFERMGGSVEMRADRPPKQTPRPDLPNLHPIRHADSQLLYELAAGQQDAESQWWREVRRADFERTIEERLGEWFSLFLGRQKHYRMAVQEFRHRFEAAIHLVARSWQGEHELKLWARPDSAERYQTQLILWALDKLREYPVWPIRTSVNIHHQAALRTLTQWGFTSRYTLLTMRRRIG